MSLNSISRWLVVLVWLRAGLVFGAGQPAEDSPPGLSVVRGQNIPVDAKQGLGAWIWTDKTFDRQSCRLWKEFELPPKTKVISARLRMTADNGYRFYLNGRELGRGADWRGITEYDLTNLLAPGRQVLAVDAFNDYFLAGLILALRIELEGGQSLDIISDPSWRVVPEQVRGWEKVKRADATWPQAVIIPTESVPQWTDPNWPYDYVTVPAFQPVITPFWQRPGFHIALAVASGLTLLVCVALIIRLAMHSKEQRLLNLERARIARDIHDELGANLTQIALLSELAQSDFEKPVEAKTHINRIFGTARSLTRSLDEIVWAVNPDNDTLDRFVAHLCTFGPEFAKAAGVRCRLDIPEDIPARNLSSPVRHHLHLAIKEALHNIVKHANATEVWLRLKLSPQEITLIVEDNGSGFRPNPLPGQDGLCNLQQRMVAIGGRFEHTSQPGRGTVIVFIVPLETEAGLG